MQWRVTYYSGENFPEKEPDNSLFQRGIGHSMVEYVNVQMPKVLV